MKLLLVEDNKDIAELIFDFFENVGVAMDYASNGIQGLNLASSEDYDCIILDIMLPGLDGLSVCQELREQGNDTPVIMLTARDTNDDTLEGFQHGADDYVIKPFELEVLQARIQAVIRRCSGAGFKKEIVCGSLHIDVQTRAASWDGKPLKLNPTCYAILLLLARSYPNPVQRNDIERHLWGDEPPEEDVLRKHIYHLRKVLDKPFAQELITTIPKVGYALAKPGNES